VLLVVRCLKENWLALALLVPGVGANDANDAFATNNFTIFAKLFD
jgi:hypothetical protein